MFGVGLRSNRQAKPQVVYFGQFLCAKLGLEFVDELTKRFGQCRDCRRRLGMSEKSYVKAAYAATKSVTTLFFLGELGLQICSNCINFCQPLFDGGLNIVAGYLPFKLHF